MEGAGTADDLGSVGGTEDEGGMSDIGVENEEIQQFLPNLEEYLTSRHGKSRSAQEAAAICSEVQKYLHHAGVEGGRKSWSAPAMYTVSLEKTNLSASTQAAKLNRIKTGMEFFCTV